MEMNKQPMVQKMTFDDCRKYFPCTTKLQELRARNHRESNLSAKNTSMERNFDLNEPFSSSDPLEASEGMDMSVGLKTLSFPSYIGKGNNMNNEGSVTENTQVGEVFAKSSSNRILINLNFPQYAPDLTLEVEIPSSSKAIQQIDDQCAQTLSPSSYLTTTFQFCTNKKRRIIQKTKIRVQIQHTIREWKENQDYPATTQHTPNCKIIPKQKKNTFNEHFKLFPFSFKHVLGNLERKSFSHLARFQFRISSRPINRCSSEGKKRENK